MPLQKQPIRFNFSQGIDGFTDPNQLSIGKFVSVQNAVFVKNGNYGALIKRNGFGDLSAIGSTSNILTTFNGNLMGIGDEIKSYSQGLNSWTNKGVFTSVQLSVNSIVKNGFNQSFADSAISKNGLVCTAYIETISSLSAAGVVSSVSTNKFVVSNLLTGETVIPPTSFMDLIVGSLTVANTFSNKFTPRVFSLGDYFTVFSDLSVTVGSVSKLYMANVNVNTKAVSSAAEFATNYIGGLPSSYDGAVFNDKLFVSWNSNDVVGSSLYSASVSSALVRSASVAISSFSSRSITVAPDRITNNVWTSFFTTPSGIQSFAYSVATDQNMAITIPQKSIGNVPSIVDPNTTSIVRNGNLNFFYQLNTVGISSVTQINQINYYNSTSSTAYVNGTRNLGLASKTFTFSSVDYFLSVYQSPYQSTYFLTSTSGFVVAKLAYGNAQGWLTQGLPSVAVIGSSAYIAYLLNQTIASVNKSTNTGSSIQTPGIFSQTGVNLATFNYTKSKLNAIDLGSNLNINGGFLWAYDGNQVAEQNSFLYPDIVGAVSGLFVLSPQAQGVAVGTYFYSCTYEYYDNQGNLFRSAPSLPVTAVVSSGSNGVAVRVYTPNITNRTSSTPNLVVYRWSLNQQNYYQVTSMKTPTPTYGGGVIVFTDTYSDAQILGNNLLYTTGGVIENISAPACTAVTLFDTRLWLIDAEDPNLLWYSKPVIEGTPVEMSDLFTIFVPPSTSVQSSTGPMRCIAPMDDKLIIFKDNTIYYINGTGPDITGTNSQYSQPIFVSSGVGCTKQSSIILTPMGLVFQSNTKGIWLLNRGLQLEYIGKDVDSYNSSVVLSALTIPGTNQIRFNLDTGEVLVYDYFVKQWGTFNNVTGVSSIVYNGLHTYLKSDGGIRQETPGVYQDGSVPVVMSFTTGWIAAAGIEGWQRTYNAYLLGNYKGPHSLNIGVATDYDPSIVQTVIINPTNTVGSGSAVEQWRINFKNQSSEAIQLTLTEVSSQSAGAALTVSAMNMTIGVKKGYPVNTSVKNTRG